MIKYLLLLFLVAFFSKHSIALTALEKNGKTLYIFEDDSDRIFIKSILDKNGINDEIYLKQSKPDVISMTALMINSEPKVKDVLSSQQLLLVKEAEKKLSKPGSTSKDDDKYPLLIPSLAAFLLTNSNLIKESKGKKNDSKIFENSSRLEYDTSPIFKELKKIKVEDGKAWLLEITGYINSDKNFEKTPVTDSMMKVVFESVYKGIFNSIEGKSSKNFIMQENKYFFQIITRYAKENGYKVTEILKQ